MKVTIVRFRTAQADFGQSCIPSNPLNPKKKELLVEQKIGHKVATLGGVREE